MIFISSLLLIFHSHLISSQLQCPEGSSFFDYQQCDPTLRSQCPAGFACRKGSSVQDIQAVVYLCCDSSEMSIEDWFSEGGLTPTIIPQNPLSQIAVIRLSDLAIGTASPEIHIGDEIITLTFPDFTTAIVQSLRTVNGMMPGGYVHSITIIDPQKKPWAIFASMNIQWPGGTFVDLTAARGGNGVFFTHIRNETVPQSDSYRFQYVVLLYQTTLAVPLTLQSDIASCEDAACVFTKPSILALGTPSAGSLFYLTTVRPVFAVDSTTTSSSSTFFTILPLMLTFIFVR